MTYPVELPLSRMAGNGLTTVFAPDFALFSLTDLVVELRDDDDLAVTIVLNGSGTYDYIVSAYIFDNASSRYTNVAVQFNNAPPTGFKIGLARAGVQEQTLDLTSGGSLPAESLERRLDRLTSLVQDLQQQVDRSLKEPVGSAALIDAGSRIITGVADPIGDTDVVTKGFLTIGSLEVDFIDGVTVSSIASLRALATGGSNPATAYVTGYISQGDGGGGLYYWDSDPTFVDDGATVIAPDSGVGSWRLNPNGWITSRQAGDLDNGETRLKATNALGSVVDCMYADPDGPAGMAYAGSFKFTTLPDGLTVTGIARASQAAVGSGDLMRKGEYDTGQAAQDSAAAVALAGKAALSHTHNYSLVTRFASSNQTLTTTGSVSHGLGAQPTPGHYGASLVCLTTDLGYSVGDRIPLGSVHVSSGGQFYHPTIYANATQVGWAMPTVAAATLYIMTKGSTTPATLTASRWAVVVWAEIVS